MAKTAKVTVIIDDNGTMRLTEASAKKLGKSLDGVSKSTRDVDRGMRGTAQMSSNTTKNFAKQSQMVGGVLVPAYATLAAQIFALTAVFRFFQAAADLRVLEEGQLSYARQTGVALGSITASLQAATEGQLAFKDAAQAASIGVAAGLTANQLQRLSTVATKASAALGRDLTDSFNRLIRGAIKAEPELLDELGIIVRLQEAAENYGRSIGKSANDLTTFEKSQAVVNAVLEQGEDKFGKFQVKVNQVNKAGKAFNDILLSLQKSIAPFAELLSEAVAQSGLFATAIAGFAFASPIRAALPAATRFEGFDREQIGRSIVGAGYTGERHQDKLLSGGFTDSMLRDIERSAKAMNSSVIEGGKSAQLAVQGFAVQARAALLHETGRMEGGINGFFKKMQAQFISARGMATGHFAAIRAAGVVAFTAIGGAVATALNVVAIAGLIFTFGQLIYTYIRGQDENEEFKKKLNETSEALEAQRKEIKKVSSELNAMGKAGSDGLLAISNMLGSLSFNIPADALSIDLEKMKSAAKDLENLRQNYSSLQTGLAFGALGGGLAGMGMAGGGMAGLAIAEQDLEKKTKLLDEQVDALEKVRKNIAQAELALATSELRNTEIVIGAMEEMRQKRKLLRDFVENKEIPTQEELADVQKLLLKLNSEGIAALGTQNKRIVEFSGKMKSATNASQDFYKTVVDGANVLTKGDTFKNLRVSIKELRETLAEEFAVAGNMSELSEGNLKNILGTNVVKKLLKETEGDETRRFELAENLLSSLAGKYQQFYNMQNDNEKKRQGILAQTAALFVDNPENKIRKVQLDMQNKEIDLKETILANQIKINDLQNLGEHTQANLLSVTNTELRKRLQLLKDEEKFLIDQIKLQDSLALIKNDSAIMLSTIKAKELRLDQRLYTNGVSRAELGVERAQEAKRANDLTIAELSQQTELTRAQEFSLALAIGKREEMDAQVEAARRGVDIAKEELRIRRELTSVSIAQETGRTERLFAENSILPSRVREEALARLEKQDLLLQAEQKLINSRKEGIMPEQRALLELQAANLQLEADLVELRLSRSYQLSQELLKETESGMTNVLQAAFMGESVTDASLMFIQSFAKALNDAVTKALVDAMMTSKAGKGIVGGITDFVSSIFGGARYGGMFTEARYGMVPSYSDGGISRGRDSGYPVMLHGTEAVVPLQDGKNIPVKMTGNAGNTNNVSVNVTVANGQTSTQVSSKNSELQARAFGQALSEAVKQEIIVQSREGGLLNRI